MTSSSSSPTTSSSSWMTGSPRSSARAMRPTSNKRGRKKPRSRSAAVSPRSRPRMRPRAPSPARRSSPCRASRRPSGDLEGVRAGSRKSASWASTLSSTSSRSKTSRLASATAQLTGWPANVRPCRNGRVAVEERLGDLVAHHHAAEGRVARGESFGHGDHVGLVADALGSRTCAEAAERADHLVGHEEHAVAVADLAHARRSSPRAGRSTARRSAPARGTPRRPSRAPPAGSRASIVVGAARVQAACRREQVQR